ncbi:subunit Rpc34 of RNA polymerase [Hamiltosporidium tvaerminnensis]|uniref:Subunit Rpc34 of RNA polymerase n=3 Tax=Hamiltosporidium TaxID=1176354 RepID=A0A4Q9LXQ5_9MICR|nr:DNA-directed RNA polymerase III subunit RPC6 [Hamiltosporidium tvaerminnensis]TBU07511.1 subunit Rpc34 of RNA polymerase [Hamiltosporidium magnivora]TBU04219.1 subunit Rpc34 of RNA polymerase [Hamiltosporidium tvaerminnensis]TBU12102.1 subunit Rpc34 of RNA polymerase [Hamiltosporidium tvaerminnensis]TBU13166.1 subunit Rpc34 of RNA polymerase [Hamiltosporidium tvaerminnensis]
MKNLLEFIATAEDGLTETDILAGYPNATQEEIAKNLNILLKKKQIDIFNDGHTLKYKASLSTMKDEEKMIHTLILESGTKGCLVRDIKNKTNIPQNFVMKILKILESKKLIKAIKSVKSNLKFYISYDQNPSEELTGGIWFNEADIDEEFVIELTKLMYVYLSKKTLWNNQFSLSKIEEFPCLETIHDHIEKTGISNVGLSLENLYTLLQVMIYDEKVEKIFYKDKYVYRALPQ